MRPVDEEKYVSRGEDFAHMPRYSGAPVAALITITIALLFLPMAVDAGKLSIGTTAPDFTLPDTKGKEVTLSEALKNGPVLLDFWALWCKPCLKALPSTNAIAKEFADRGLTVFAINTDSPRSSSKVRPYVKSKGYTFRVLMDPNRTMQRVFRFTQIPQVYLINSDGSIAYSQIGYSHALEKRLYDEVSRLFGPDDSAGEDAVPASESNGEE